MNWQVKFALQYFQNNYKLKSIEHVRDDSIKIVLLDGSEAIAVISESYTMTASLVAQYYASFPDMNFLCGYRKECIWEGEAILCAQKHRIGWGNAGSLGDAVSSGDFINSEHKHYSFAYRLIRQNNTIQNLCREYDRVFSMTLRNGQSCRVGMILEYEPTADSIRTFWDQFGSIDVAWNINPNGDPTEQAIEAGRELGCKVVKLDGVKKIIYES